MLPLTYFNSVSAISNVWRATGVADKLKAKAADLYSDHVAITHFKRIPGQPLNSRWGAIAAIESLLMASLHFLGVVFAVVFGHLKHQKAKKNKGPTADEDDRYFEEQKTSRLNATTLLNDKMFQGMLIISKVGKSPWQHFLLWTQKAKKKHTKVTRISKQLGHACLGPTPNLQLVCFKGTESARSFDELLGDEAVRDASLWGLLWPLVPAGLTGEVRIPIVSIVLMGAASWDFRVTQRITEHVSLLLVLVGRPPHEADPRRQVIATELLDAEAELLETNNTDVPLKLRKVFAEELEHVKLTGTCPPKLFSHLLLLRAAWPIDTQDVEGMNSTLQEMCSSAPYMKHALASDRMEIKFGDDISAAALTSIHKKILAEMGSEKHADRFKPLSADTLRSAPAEASDARKRPRTYTVRHLLVSKGFAMETFRQCKIGARHAWAFDGGATATTEPRQCWLMCWPYYKTLYSAHATLRRLTGGTSDVFMLSLPIRISRFVDVATASQQVLNLVDNIGPREQDQDTEMGAAASSSSALGPLPPKRRKKEPQRLVLQLYKYNVQYASLCRGSAVNEERIDIAYVVPPAVAAMPSTRAAEEEGMFDLEAELARVMEMTDSDQEESKSSDAEVSSSSSSSSPSSKTGSSSSSSSSSTDDNSNDADEPVVGNEAIEAIMDGVANAVRARRLNVQEAVVNALASHEHVVKKGSVSLVVRTTNDPDDGSYEEVTFVVWTDAINRRGRKVTIDNLGRIVSIVAYSVEIEDFPPDTTDELIAVTGAVMRRRRPTERELMIPWCLVMYNLERIKRHCGPMSRTHPYGSCIVCSAASTHDRTGFANHLKKAKTSPLYCCTACGCPWHVACMKLFSETVQLEAFRCPDPWCTSLGDVH